MSASHHHDFHLLGNSIRRAQELTSDGAETMAQVEGLMEEATRLRGHSNGLVAKPNVHVIDADDAFCASTRQFLTGAGFQVRTCSTASQFLNTTIDDGLGCILLDLNLPGLGGLELQTLLGRRPNPLPIIFVAANSDIPTVVRAMKAGAVDFLVKPPAHEILLESVNRALALFRRQQQHRHQLAKWQTAFDSLSQRELEVFELVAAGKMNKEIASDLGISLRTVKAHRGHVMTKMRVSSLAELVHIADWLEGSRSAATPSL